MENSVEVEILSICWTVAEVKISFFPSYFFGLKNMLRSLFSLVIHYCSDIVVWKCVCCKVLCNFLYSISWQRYQTWIIILIEDPNSTCLQQVYVNSVLGGGKWSFIRGKRKKVFSSLILSEPCWLISDICPLLEFTAIVLIILLAHDLVFGVYLSLSSLYGIPWSRSVRSMSDNLAAEFLYIVLTVAESSFLSGFVFLSYLC